jgi:hypothetical protein
MGSCDWRALTEQSEVVERARRSIGPEDLEIKSESSRLPWNSASSLAFLRGILITAFLIRAISSGRTRESCSVRTIDNRWNPRHQG